MLLPFDRLFLGRGLRAAIALVGLGGAAAIASPVALAQPNNETYPPNFEQEFTEGCLLNAMRAGGLSPETAEDYCGCNVTTIQQRYSFQQAIALYEQVGQSNDGRLPAELEAIANQCLKTALENRNARPNS
ncbi:MAG: hypothetical protein Fur0042_19850 [Cyanophyceae cyanobacterium]